MNAMDVSGSLPRLERGPGRGASPEGLASIWWRAVDGDDVPVRVLHGICATAIVLLGAAATAFAVQRAFINEDGISYLDVADAFTAAGWSAGLNAYWSPLYPLLLAGALRIVQPLPEGEILVVQLVNYAIFLVAFAAFVAFWRELEGSATAPRRMQATLALSAVQWWVLGYLLFAWCALRLIQVWTTSPDMAVLAAVLAAATLLLKIRRRPEAWTPPLLLGISLGLGYLAKAVMFPLAVVFFIAATGAFGRVRLAVPRLVAAVIVFALIATPAVVTLSLREGVFTFGSAGRLNYARFVNGLPDIHWQGEFAGSGSPAHPTRQLSSMPRVFEFAGPVGGTYPVWYDPTYWYAGVEAPVDLRRQIAALARTATDYTRLFLVHQGAALALLALLFALRRTSRIDDGSGWLRQWILWFPAAAACGLYALVYVEPRYVAPFVILLWGAALSLVRLPDATLGRHVLRWSSVGLAAILLANLLMPNEKSLGWALDPERVRGRSAGPYQADIGETGAAGRLPVARALTELGLGAGDGVAFIGYSYAAYWARLAGLRIVAEIPAWDADLFWQSDAARQEEILGTLLSTGARAVVATGDPRHPPSARWERLGRTGYYAVVAMED